MMNVSHTVVRVLADHIQCPVDDISLDNRLRDLHLDSLELLEVGLELEEHFGQAAYLGSHDLQKIKTVNDLVNFISSRL